MELAVNFADNGLGLLIQPLDRLRSDGPLRFAGLELFLRGDALLQQLPQCEAIVTTGQKATDTLCALFSLKEPKVGDFTEFIFEDRPIRLYRMPSSSRAYPLALEKKAAAYRVMYQDLQML